MRSTACAIGLGLILLAGCARVPAVTGHRDTATIIASTTRFEAQRFAGDWVVRAAYPQDADLRGVTARQDGTAFTLLRHRCDATGQCGTVAEVWPATATGQGRYALRDPSGTADRTLWVLWVDDGFRTAAVGTPDGRWGWILDRSTSGGADRIAAAREVLDFNGYDLTHLAKQP
ncbi:lipocalin family protein [Pseudosulfitobacter pseudonitzschiae]|uniref:lipocalin family protein n=1 Tax=Pseudosulfitobacter pseudonitzschiae TaxID=1402135 RepID=UPI001AF12865|nr:lipocalin family protein [Pseudosulfitobacter pseudonitzschiae]MBM1815319.1 lipocalin family protein [Pseudosulfitobacter pseudonitzschiae]MBM1832310.1 lipocalin family protein [Pseudosulfitobacter pseudonitzschiae]MBM1837178.1 lipocalin family protein [Pseudosulfitobacter pseudonitzschiae]MBM1842024.1 lipocalin family protein [Pseudosulfitobacter pseudonitzschiae]MBM1846892.1 lipocalin family protein [Pseudosulfitobacter pseudonitzschiae]